MMQRNAAIPEHAVLANTNIQMDMQGVGHICIRIQKEGGEQASNAPRNWAVKV